MKKSRILALALCAGLLLSGCDSMLERSYSSHTAHVDYSVTEDSSILRAESYQALVNSILYYVDEHAAGGTIRLYNYTGDVEADLQRACLEVTEEDPLGAYAVHRIEYDSTRILTYYEITLRISYQRTADQLVGIRTVSGLNGIRQELARTVSYNLTQSVSRTAYYDGDSDAVTDLFWLAFYGNPLAVAEIPRFSAEFYPREGTQRILELQTEWPLTAKEMRDYAADLTEAAARLTAEHPPVGEAYTPEELAALLRSVVVYDPSGSHTALAALQGEPVNDLGMLLALELLYQQAGIEVLPVADTTGAQMWLIIGTPSGYRHLLPRDLRPDEPAEPTDPEASTDPEISPDPESSAAPQPPAETEPWHLPLYTDDELLAMGFTWPAWLHPVCVDYSGTLPE